MRVADLAAKFIRQTEADLFAVLLLLCYNTMVWQGLLWKNQD